MEVVHHGRRIRREMSTSPERGSSSGGKVCVHHQARARGLMRASFKKVQLVYYLSRNGHLEHPHYLELTHLAHQPLLLKDFMDKLTMLRGKGMPSFYSWSCKRNYKNGYVWNDVCENDVIYPSEGAEYVLKGSELIEGCTNKMNHLQVSNGESIPPITNRHSRPVTNFHSKRSPMASTRMREPEEMANTFRDNEGKVQEEEQDFEYEVKTSYVSSATPLSRQSMGVSTDDIQEFKQQGNPKNTPVEFNSYSSPPSTPSSTSLSDKAINEATSTNNVTKRFEDGDPVSGEPLLDRNSMLLSLIACGGSGSFRKPVPPPSPPPVSARKSMSKSSLHKGVVCKAAAAKIAVEEDEATMIVYMSENPRFGNMQSEEKEYFSGSIVESMTNEDRLAMNEPSGLKKSLSYNEERSNQAGLEEVVAVEKEVKKDKGAKGKCIPRIMF